MNKAAILERIEKCKQILETNPDSQIFAALAEAYRKVGDLKSALDTCDDGLKRHPEYGSAYLVLAKIARDQKRYADAEIAAQKAISLEGRTRSAEILLSDIYLQTGKFVEAESILNRLAKADPGNQSVKKLIELVAKAKRAAELSDHGRSSSVRIPVQKPAPSAPEPSEPPTRAAEPPPQFIPELDQAAATPQETPEIPAPPVESPDPSPWRDAFEVLDRFPHLRGRLAVGYDGLLLDTDMRVRSDAEGAAAMSAELFSSVKGEWPQQNFGPLDQIMIETGQSVWWIWPFPEHLLVLWCDPNVNMGPLRLRLTQLEGYLLTSTEGGSR